MHSENVIYFNVTSDGTTGLQWIDRLTHKGVHVSESARSVLRSPKFRPSTPGRVINLALLPGSMFADAVRTTAIVHHRASTLGLSRPDAEVACLFREICLPSEVRKMGLTWVMTMHRPIEDADESPAILHAAHHDTECWLDTFSITSTTRFGRANGFLFVASYG